MRNNNLKKIMAVADASSVIYGNVCVLTNTNIDTIDNSKNSEVGKNLALKKLVEASSSEKDVLGAYNITNGKIDRKNLKSRWSSAYDADNPWVTIDLGEITSFNEVVIEWERRNVTSYEIQGSNDNENWAVIKNLGRPKDLREAVEFEDQEFRYVKLQIKSYGEDGVEGEIPWLIVSIYEIEVYKNRRADSPEVNVIEFNQLVEKSKSEQIREKSKRKRAKVAESKSKVLNVNLGQAVVVDMLSLRWDKIFSARDKHKFVNSEGKEKRVCAGGKSPPHSLW